MSPVQEMKIPLSPSFPRVSGDEPHIHEVVERRHRFSPRERG